MQQNQPLIILFIHKLKAKRKFLSLSLLTQTHSWSKGQARGFDQGILATKFGKKIVSNTYQSTNF